ncbi:MAG TPA: hypothetical protein DCE42_15830 [Myxococcales bacterium]|nr:hypothetical protein [Deltaproteobacteria bacterium]HAA56234.1 hypothetical protein [Myxococcales bacterium]
MNPKLHVCQTEHTNQPTDPQEPFVAKDQNTSTTLADIAEQIGYSSESAFSKAFKKFLGIPPTMYRKQPALTPIS